MPGPAPDAEIAVEELEDRRDATTRVFQAEDGSLLVEAHTSPINYLDEAGQWTPIDNSVEPVPDDPGTLVSDDAAFTTTFRGTDEGVELRIGEQAIGVRPVTEEAGAEPDPMVQPVLPADEDGTVEAESASPSTAADVEAAEGLPEPELVEYPQTWPDVDLEYRVTNVGLKEDIVLHGPDVPDSYSFDIDGTALEEDFAGGIRLQGGLGDFFTIRPLVVIDASGADVTQASGAAYSLSPGPSAGTTRLTVTLDRAWLSGLAHDRFPVRVDPSFDLVNPSAAVTWANNNAASAATPVAFGRDATSGFIYRAALHFGQYEGFLTGGWRVYNAQLQFSGQTDTSPAITVYDQGVYGEGVFPGPYNTIGNGVPVALNGIWSGPFVDVSRTVDQWVTGGPSQLNRWFGIRTVETGNTFRFSTVRLIMRVYQPPQPSYVTNLAAGSQQVLSTATPTLQSLPVPFAPNGSDPATPVYHEFRVTTSPSPDAGLVLSSGMIQQPTPTTGVSWTVPSGALVEGLSYWAWVLTDFPQYGGPPAPTSPTQSRQFTVDLGLGDGGPSPTDQLGSVPGGSALVSEGAPSPSLPGSTVTVNQVDGNLSATFGTRTLGTLGGPLALAFTFNSLAPGNQGLRAEYYNDTNSSGQIDSGDTMVAQRVDPTVSFNWGFGILAKPVAAIDPARALARWTGQLTVPSATTRTWQIGAISSDGIRATINSTTVLDRWAPHEPEAAPVFDAATFTASSAVPVTISAEWRNAGGAGVARLFLRDVTSPSNPITYALSPQWLTQNTSVLPPGWTLNAAAGSARWVGLADRGTSVSVFEADGSAREFVAAGNGSYRPPLDAPRDLLTLGDGGRFVLQDAGGSTYTFSSTGTLESLVSASDDRSPAALEYTYSGTPLRLRAIQDPVSERSVELAYGGESECPTTPAAASGFLCRVDYWDGVQTTLSYDTTGRLTSVTNPGGIVHDFQYTNATFPRRITAIQDPLTNDAIAAGVRLDDANSLTEIVYQADGKVFLVAQPAPTASALRPYRTYGYDPVNRTGDVYVAGFTPTTAYAERTRYDTRNRIVETIGPDGRSATYGWDTLDRLVMITNTFGFRTTTFYDHASRPVTNYGPAPVSSFQASGLPVGGASVPATTRSYDGGIAGLAAVYWDNPFLAGGPSLHDTGLGLGGTMDRDWDTSLPIPPGPGGWSARYTGYLNVSAGGTYLFQAATRGTSARVWVDDVLVADHVGAEPATGFVSTTGPAAALTTGQHRIRVDMIDTAGPAGLRVLWRPAASGTFAPISGSLLSPDYGLVTQVTDPDGRISRSEFADPAAGIGPHLGLETATIVDPLGANLRTSTTYETPGPDTFLRRTALTLPGGNTWTTTNYAGTEGPISAACGVDPATAQAGLPKRVTGPDPDGGGPELPRVEEYVYDAIGRQVGRRIGDSGSVSTSGWVCTTYDARGRISSVVTPAHGASPARTVSHTYGVSGNPLVNRTTDDSWGSASITATVDLLGRPINYVDIWGNATATAFDQAGRQTSTVGPLGTIAQNYVAANGRMSTTVINGSTTATPSYDSVGRLSAVTYLGGAATTHSYDGQGRPNGIGVFDAQGITGDTVTRSLAGRVIDQTTFNGTAFVDANAGGPNYVYDGAGRLTSTILPGATFSYGFGTTSGCTAPNAGANTNRTSLTITGVGATASSSCYDAADRLESTTSAPVGTIDYDDHGNTVRLGDDYFEFDSSDRHVRTETPAAVTTYRRDPVDRVAERIDTPRVSHIATSSANAAAAAVSVARPSGTAAGDLLVASVSANGLLVPGTVTSSGWTVASQQTNLTNRTAILWRYATAGDPSSWSFTSSLATSSSGAISTYRATAGSTPVAATAVSSALLASSHPVPQVTTTSDAAQLVHAIGFAGSTSATPPAGTTARSTIAAGASLLVADRSQTDPGLAAASAATTAGLHNSASVTVAISAVTTTTRPGYSEHSDRSQFTYSPSAALVDFAIPLMGATVFSWSAGTSFRMSHTNLHGDVVTVTDLAGNRVWTGLTGPYGEIASTTTPLNTGVSGTRLGWHGQQLRTADRSIMQLGARPYSPANGRFLSVDPVEGGCANNYVYGFGDPIQGSDLTGTEWWDPRDWGDEIASFADWVWDRTGGKVFTCDDNGVTEFIETFGLIPTLSGPEGEIRDGAAEYIAVGNIGAVLTGLNILVQTGRLEASARLASRIATASSVFQGVVYAATLYQIGRHFLC